MSFLKFLFVTVLALATAIAAPSPHIGMVNNDDVRDVGAVYSQPGYASKPEFLLMDKKIPKCNPLDDNNIWSIMICVESIECDFWKDTGCGSTSGEQAVFMVGCGDVHDVPPALASKYGSYTCHSVDPNAPGFHGAVKLETTPHDPNNDLSGQV
ncbi:hypothetical protein CUC08_Gglean011722 [Alternaria sp. MG1]|uniref:Uncharacterized protein n=1 Tax=Alternaria tenuissima TaxID=119927 RepID=A0A4Q4MCV9_9PLEO|nr:hypothetical protein CUC08_Gglean011722 [Alternaria sp. MG1]RYN48396.1 hypothetical protein AA0114_g7100 [Alternaria tenuissima]